MELTDTVKMMNSSDYKERYKAEYFQLKIRYEKLYLQSYLLLLLHYTVSIQITYYYISLND